MRVVNLMDPRWLAAALIAYEADVPHTGDDPSPYYPPIEPDMWEAKLQSVHCGDCIGQPNVCDRCVAEDARHKAEWIIQQAKRLDEKRRRDAYGESEKFPFGEPNPYYIPPPT